MNEINEMLKDENDEVQAEAIGAACAIFKADAVSIARSYIKSPAARVKRRALECLLRHGAEGSAVTTGDVSQSRSVEDPAADLSDRSLRAIARIKLGRLRLGGGSLLRHLTTIRA